MQPKFRQRLSNIQLLALVKSRAVTEYGMNHILDILLQDIKKLENVRPFLCYSYNSIQL